MRRMVALLCLLAFQLHGLEYEPQFENDQICVAKVSISPHEEIGLHRDAYPQVVIALKGGTITRLEENGQTSDVVFPTGVAVYRDADPENVLHKSLNTSSEPVELILIQLKSNPLAFPKATEDSH